MHYVGWKLFFPASCVVYEIMTWVNLVGCLQRTSYRHKSAAKALPDTREEKLINLPQ